MGNLLPIILPAIGLIFLASSVFLLYCVFRAERIVPSGEPTSISSAAVEAEARTRLRYTRIVGVFWSCLGIAVLWFSDIRDLWILPSVGLFWAVLGGWMFLATFRQGSQSATAAEALAKSFTDPDARRRVRRSQFVTAVFFLCLGVPLLCLFPGIRIGAAPAAVSRPPEESGRLAEIVTQHVERDIAQQGRVGLVVGAIAKNEEVLLGFGARQLGASQPPDADTVFEIGSITKTFTGILLAQQIENGELELDDRIAELLPSGWSLSESAREVTLRHCTTHTSGIPRLPANLLGFSSLWGGDPYRDYSEEQFRDALATVELEFDPGTEHNYSNFAVGLLGYVLATQNGADYERLVTSKICQPLGMHSTAVSSDQWRREQMPAKYESILKLGPAAVAIESDEWRIPNHLAGAGALRSTGRDMMTYLKANMGLLPTPIDAAIQRSHQRVDTGMGMNWIRSYESDISQHVIWHNGGTGGFSTYLGFTEDRQFGVFVLSNTAVRVDALASGMLDALVREYAPGSRKLVTRHGYAKVAPYTGVRWENGRPVVQVKGRWSRLVSIDGIPVDRIMGFAQHQFGDKARKRFAEDLVELLSKMGHEPEWEVTLGLETSDGKVEQMKVSMTKENRNRIRQ